MEEIKLNQEDMKRISEGFYAFFCHGGFYPKNYYEDYIIGWEFCGKFYIGTPDEGDDFVQKHSPVWNFPIINKNDYPDIEIQLLK